MPGGSGSRILVVVPSEPNAHTAESVDVAVGDRTDTAEDSNESDTPTTEPSPEPDEPAKIVSSMRSDLSAELVVRQPETVIEYARELEPTIACAVFIERDVQVLEEFVSHTSIPAIVYDPPVVERIDAAVSGLDSFDDLLEQIESELEETHTRNQLQDSASRLAALSRYASDITSCETIDQVAERTVEATVNALAYDHCVVLLAEETKLVPSASTLPEPVPKPCDVCDGIAGRTFQRGRAEIIADMQTDSDAVVEHDDLHGVLSVPIEDRGVIQVLSEEPNAFSLRDLDFVEILAGYSHEALERLEREVSLRQERDRLHAFFGDIPAPAIYVERREDTLVIEEMNRAYGGEFTDVDTKQPLAEVVQSDAEMDLYERGFASKSVAEGAVQRTGSEGEQRTYTLSVVPIEAPSDHECAYGIYLGAKTVGPIKSAP